LLKGRMSGVTAADLAVWAVVAARFLVPLAIPRWPLPGVLGSMALDAADQGVLEALLGAELPGYQPYDKALDVYSLSVSMLATLRNWGSRPAVQIARVLFYFRLVGVLGFELTGRRPLLLLFPNTFEYFFVLYEVVRGWWSPARLRTRTLVRAAALVWVAKLPHEYWLHVARLDLTDVVKERVLGAASRAPWAEAAAQLVTAAGAVVAGAIGAVVVRATAPPPEHPRRLRADPLPVSIDEAHERARHVARHWRVVDRHLVEKVVLVGLLTVIFARIVPGIDASPAQLVGGVVAVATWNSFLRLRTARSGRSVEPAALEFAVLVATNGAFVLGADLLLRRGRGGLPVPAAVFFLLLLSLVVTMYDRWHPVFDVRFGPAASP
jgi:hypothetical protein